MSHVSPEDDVLAAPLVPPPVSKMSLLLCSLLFGLLCARKLSFQYLYTHTPFFVDDAFYYFVLARHLVQQGRSTFDGLTLTNGYHPLWMAVVALQYKLLSTSLLLTRCIEFLLGMVTLLTALLVVRLPNLLLNLVFTIGLFALLTRIAFNGMETALFSCCFGLLIYFSRRRRIEQPERAVDPARGSSPAGKISPAQGLFDGLLAAAAIAARIDAAVFVVPQLFFATRTAASRSWQRRVLAFAVLLVCGSIYAAVNLRYFGVAFPISGEIKSLGGLQVNHPLLRLLARPAQADALMFYFTVVLFLASPFILSRTRNAALRPVLLAFMTGFPVFVLRLAFFSSWTIWEWYDYPLLLGYIACVPALLLYAEGQLKRIFSYRQLLTATSLLILLLAAFAVRGLLSRHTRQPLGYFAVNREAIEQNAATLGGSTVAMGDRAGDFAYLYSGGVEQLEGLMNDQPYFKVLSHQGDIRKLLCQRDVRFLVAYEPDLGNYQSHLVKTIRPQLSQYPAPTIVVSHGDEVAKVSDFAQYNSSRTGDTTSYLYIWKLSCGAGSGGRLP